MKTWQENSAGMQKESKPNFNCRYCNKSFRRESTLSVHNCEPKRRWQQEKEQGVQLGLRAWLRFFELTQGSAQTKSYADFVVSQYYLAFVKFGRHLVAIKAINPSAFIDYVIRQNKKLDQWTYESIYVEYLHQYLKKEAVQDALERSLLEMQDYVDKNPQIGTIANYFNFGNSNRICFHISTGRVSPWVVFNCNSGIAFLETLTEEQIAQILPWIDPTYWDKKFKDYVADRIWIQESLHLAGL